MPTLRITLTKNAIAELKTIAEREKRTTNAQAAYILENAIPAMHMRRNSDTDTQDLGKVEKV